MNRVVILLALCLFAVDIYAKSDPALPIDKPGWTLTFSDEFNGDRLDESKWTDHYWHGRTHANHELQYYASDGYALKDGQLRLTARPVSADARSKTAGLPYTSGMISSFGKFAQQYGWFEMRARIPKGKGYWPAFWLLPDDKRWPPEIDILEILGHQPDVAHFTTHWRDAQRRHLDDTHEWRGPDFSAGFHTFAVDWEPGLVVWYVDGIERARTSKGVPNVPMYVIANLAVGGDWPGNPDATTQFPQSMDIDYIRVYQKKPEK